MWCSHRFLITLPLAAATGSARNAATYAGRSCAALYTSASSFFPSFSSLDTAVSCSSSTRWKAKIFPPLEDAMMSDMLVRIKRVKNL